jgi:hypothetical protein
MASVNIMSILQSSYSAASQQSQIPVGAKFAPVDPTKYTGTWTGKDSTGQAFSLVISKVSGYRANVTYQSAAGGLQYQRVFISTKSSFRIGDSSFILTGTDKAIPRPAYNRLKRLPRPGPRPDGLVKGSRDDRLCASQPRTDPWDEP